MALCGASLAIGLCVNIPGGLWCCFSGRRSRCFSGLYKTIFSDALGEGGPILNKGTPKQTTGGNL